MFNVRGPENVQLRAFAYDIAIRTSDDDEDEIFDPIVRDRQTGTNELVSIADDGMKSSNHVDWTSISADGQHVGFSAFASSLSPIDDGIAPGDDDERDDIYLRDRETGDVVMVSMGLTEERGDITMADPWVSDDGQRILYTVGKNDGTGIFVYLTDRTRGISMEVGPGHPSLQIPHLRMSADGQWLVDIVDEDSSCS